MQTTEATLKREVEYDLSTVLVRAGTLYEKRLGEEWLLYAPDWLGWPIIVEDSIHRLLESFRAPSAVGVALAGLSNCSPATPPGSDLSVWTKVVAFLEEAGFLRAAPTELPYIAPLSSTSSPKQVEVWLHVTSACNLTCAYCFVKKKDAGTMSDSVCDATVARLAHTAIENDLESVTVKFAGGEPTLVLPLVERFWYGLQAALAGTRIQTRAALLSNGTNVSDRVLAFLQQPNASISISLDGYGDYHDVYRRTSSGGKTWTCIARNIDLLEVHGIKPFIMATISDRTRNGLPDLLRWLLSRHLKTRISIVRHLAGGAEADHTAYALRMASSFVQAFSVLESERISFDPRHDLHVCELRFNQPVFWVPCGIGWNHLVIASDGRLASCPMTVDDPGQPAGQDLLTACRKTFPFEPTTAREGTEGAQCIRCTWFPVCGGGCPVNNHKTRGHPFARSPFCAFYQSVIPSYIELFGHQLQRQRDDRQRQGLQAPTACVPNP